MQIQYKDGRYYAANVPSYLKSMFYECKETGYLFTRNHKVAHAYMDYAIDEQTKEVMRTETKDQNFFIRQSYSRNSEIDIPKQESNEYYPFQVAGVEYIEKALTKRNGVVLADDMGLGKTVQAIGYINRNCADINRIIVVSNVAAKYVWKSHFENWLIRKRKVQVLSSGDDFPEDYEILIVNYNIIHRYWFELQVMGDFDLMICDESHYLKNPKSQRTVNVLGGVYKDQPRGKIAAVKSIFITGTPIEARPAEFWTLLNAIDKETWPYWEYMYRYCKPYFHKTRGWSFLGADNLDELRQRVRGGYMVRRMKNEVLHDLPDKVETIVEIEDEKISQREIQELDRLSEMHGQLASLSMDKYHGLTATIRHKTAKLKIPHAIEYIKNVLSLGHKAIVFGVHKDVLTAIRDKFPGCVGITGETKEKDRRAAEHTFQNDPKCRLFYGNIAACGSAITLHAANVVIFIEYERAPGKNDQAIDRARRIGQKQTVYVVKFAFKNSIDSVFLKSEKRNRFNLEKLN